MSFSEGSQAIKVLEQDIQIDNQVVEGLVTKDRDAADSEGSTTVSQVQSKSGGLSLPEGSNADIAFSGKELNPWSKAHIGIPINYYCIGLILSGSTHILYPLLIINQGVNANFYAAASQLVQIFWNYKILFGTLCDCFPIMGYHRKPYIILGWVLCACALVGLASKGRDVSAVDVVTMMTFANFGYMMADVAADGYVVWMAHRERLEKRGGIQSLIYTMREVGKLSILGIIIIGFSGPQVMCAGYESNIDIPCTDDLAIANRNGMIEIDPEGWCHQQCDAATFTFGLTIPQYAWIIAIANIVSIPFYAILFEEKGDDRGGFSKVLKEFWVCLKKRAVWQVMLYSMVSSLTFDVFVAAKVPANFVWLGLSNFHSQVLNILGSIFFALGLSVIRKYALNFSWRKMIWIGSLSVSFFHCLYLLIAFNIYRSVWFYIFTEVCAGFLRSINFLASVFAIVEVSEPGFEAITYALVTTASNSVGPLSSVASQQFMALFPDLNMQESLATDTISVRNQFAWLILITEAINLTSLISLPLLPRQKRESRALMQSGETSSFWASFTMLTGLGFLIYSSCVTILTVLGAEKYGCYKVLGGEGCTFDESSVPTYILLGVVFLYCYGVSFVLIFLPIIQGKKKFSMGMFF